MKYFFGIDPGKKGGIVLLNKDGKFFGYHFIPKTKDNEIDIKKLNDIFKLKTFKDSYITIEKVHAIFGSAAKATFDFGKTVGIKETILIVNNLQHDYVAPKDWQKVMFEGIEPIYKSSKKKGRGTLETKLMAIEAYKKLFPSVDLYITEEGNKSKNVHDGICDALLIAEYGRRKYLGLL
jgi:hypothetical protein